MKAILLLLFLCVLGIGRLTAQLEFLYHENPNASLSAPLEIEEAPDGTIITVGDFSDTLTLGNITLPGLQYSFYGSFYAARFNPASGTWLWAKAVYSTNGGARLNDMRLDNAGNIYLTGWYIGSVSFGNITLTSTNYTGDAFVAKMDLNGNFVWVKSFGSKIGSDAGHGLTLDSSNNIIWTGHFTKKAIMNCSGHLFEVYDIAVTKLNNAGTLVWQKRWSPSQASCNNWGMGKAVETDHLGNIYFTGEFRGTFSLGSTAGLTIASPSSISVFTAKLSSNGDALWVQTGISTHSSYSYDIDVYNDNVYVATGFNSSLKFGNITLTGTFPIDNPALTKYAANGALQWAVVALNGTEVLYQQIRNVHATADGNAVVSLSYYGTKTFSGANGSEITSLPLTNTLFLWENIEWAPKSMLVDFNPSANGFVYIIYGYCGDVQFDNLAWTSECNDCANWNACYPLSNPDIILLRNIGGGESCPDADNDGICDDADLCPDMPVSLEWTPCDDGNPCTLGDVYAPWPDCMCIGYQEDPNCESCDNLQSASITPNPLVHQGPGLASTNHLNLPTGSGYVEFTITGLNAVVSGNPNSRYIERVKVYLINGNGIQMLYGTFNGNQQSSVNVVLQGPIQSVWATLEDGFDGNSSVQMSVSFSAVTYCQSAFAAPPAPGNISFTNLATQGEGLNLFSVFPNPATDEVHLTLPALVSKALLTICDPLGRVMDTQMIEPGNRYTTIMLGSEYADGLYLLNLYNGNEQYSQRLMITASK